MDKPTSDQERRRAPRLVVNLPCRIQSGGDKSVVEATLVDIGFEGANVGGTFPLPNPGDAVELQFTLKGRKLDGVEALVVWSKPWGTGAACGLRFEPRWTDEIKKAILEARGQSILVVEDNPAIQMLLLDSLGGAGYTATIADTMAKGIAFVQDKAFDLVVLDLMLPDGSGFEILKKIRSHRTRFATPVIVLTADQRLDSKLTGLDMGADLYLHKPVDNLEFLFWVSSLLRRVDYAPDKKGVISLDGFSIDPNAHRVRVKDLEIVNLTHKEFDLLYHLVASRPKVLSKQYILSKLWHTVLTDNTVEVHVRNIRQKLGEAGKERILTVPGKGYRFA